MTSKPRARRAGARWRLLVHEWTGRKHGSRFLYGKAHHVSSAPGKSEGLSEHHHLPNTDFDELVVGSWLHVEQMDSGLWWMDIGGVIVHVHADRDGRPTRVNVQGPGDYSDAVRGVQYELAWGKFNDKVIGTKDGDTRPVPAPKGEP